jgi:hypothetical protein
MEQLAPISAPQRDEILRWRMVALGVLASKPIAL